MSFFLKKLGIVGEVEQKIFWIFLAVFIATEFLLGFKDSVAVLLPISVAVFGMGSFFLEWEDEWVNFLMSMFPLPDNTSNIPPKRLFSVELSFISWTNKPLLSPPRSCLA